MQIGRGSFGKVFLAKCTKNDKQYAIKQIRKDHLLEHDQVENTLFEMSILTECQHQFLCGVDYVFQNELRIYFVMPFINGGELYKIHEYKERFSEEIVVFYAV